MAKVIFLNPINGLSILQLVTWLCSISKKPTMLTIMKINQQ